MIRGMGRVFRTMAVVRASAAVLPPAALLVLTSPSDRRLLTNLLLAGVPLSYLLTRGQSIKVFSQLLRKAAAKGFVIPNIKVQGPVAGADGVGYEGATVLDPKIGFYDRECCCCLGQPWVNPDRGGTPRLGAGTGWQARSGHQAGVRADLNTVPHAQCLCPWHRCCR